MKTELIDISATVKEIKVEIPAATVKEVYVKVSAVYARSVTVPGFRKGFAPLDVVKMRFKEEIKQEVFRELLPNQVTDAIRDLNLSPLGEPQLRIENLETLKVNGTEPIELRVNVEVMPEIPAPNYKGIEASRAVRPVGEEELDRVIDERLRQSATLVPVEDRKSQEGDTMILDLVGVFVEKPEEDPIQADDIEITLGAENIEKAFTDNLVGLSDDEEKEFLVDYPADFSSQLLAGQKVNYKAKVKSIGVIEVPKADDEWAQSLEEDFKSMKDLRKKLRSDMELAAKNEAENAVRDQVLTKLIDGHEIEVPTALVSIQARTLLNNFAQDLANQGMDLNGMDKSFVEMAYQQMLGQAERDVRGAMLLEKVAEIEGLEVSAEEIDEEITRMADYYRVKPEEVRSSLEKQGGDNSIADRLRSRKAVECLVENAKVTDGEWVDPSKMLEPEPEKETKKAAKKPAKEKADAEAKPKKTKKKAE